MVAERVDLAFGSGGERCAAWLYLPAGEGPHPAVVMAHGFAGTREARLWAYAERFQAAGFATLVFDYRYFGDSTGEPRQQVSVRRQLEDWRNAIASARTLERIDPDRVALWGTSLSGGHVVGLAADDPRTAAVIAQTPFANGPSEMRAMGPRAVARLTTAGLRDVWRAVRRGEPHRVPAVGMPGETAAMTRPGSFEGYRALFESPERFHNEFGARGALTIPAYAPSRKASRVRCPLLVVTCAGDRVTPPAASRRIAERAPRGEHVEYGPGWGHFDIYVGEMFERAVADQVAFLERHLLR